MYKWIKQILDFVFSFSLIMLLSPIFILVSLGILIAMGAPVLYKQERIGLDNRSFVIYKFRSMDHKSEIKQTDEQRINYFGKLLRQFRIDELPQLFNILLGKMSFIGPRPLLPDYLPYYTEFEIRRHEVKPGLSGYSQVSSLNYIEWEDQFKLDVYYVDNISLKLDAIIFYKTMAKVIRPSNMIRTGYVGRTRFDAHRKKQMEA
jgi:undecaprenyl phosphate N,N'-diacetylbacillosamine 1-phosphate transferase